MKSILGLVALSMLALGSSAFASGWNCWGEDGYRAKLINSTTSTRTPAVFVVSHKTDGTLLTAKKDAIRKRNLRNGVRYVATATDNDAIIGDAILFVAHREGVDKALERGETVEGKLVVEKTAYDMTCSRYLKN